MKKLFMFAMLLATSPVNYAFTQNITACLTVNTDQPAHWFRYRIQSSDLFDAGTEKGINQGSGCVYHTYKSGPKNIRVGITIANKFYDTLFNLDKSCDFLHQSGDATAESDYMKTASPNEKWDIVLNKTATRINYNYVFNVSCRKSVA